MSKGKHRDEHKDNNITNSGEELGKKNKIREGGANVFFFLKFQVWNVTKGNCKKKK